MTALRLIQNFRGLRGVLWGGPTTSAETLRPALARLGMVLSRMEDLPAGSLSRHGDVLFVDGDCILDPTTVGRTDSLLPVVPAIGLVGIETPSRLKALSDMGVTALLRKPVYPAAVYSSLFLAVNGYNRLDRLESKVAEHDRRRSGQRFVIKAVVDLMRTSGLTDDEAYALLRRESMRGRVGIEDYARSLAQQRDNRVAGVNCHDTEQQESSNETTRNDACGGAGGGSDAGVPGADPGGGADQTRCA